MSWDDNNGYGSGSYGSDPYASQSYDPVPPYDPGNNNLYDQDSVEARLAEQWATNPGADLNENDPFRTTIKDAGISSSTPESPVSPAYDGSSWRSPDAYTSSISSGETGISSTRSKPEGEGLLSKLWRWLTT